MQGTINFPAPLSNFKFSLNGFFFNYVDHKLTVYVNIFLNQIDFDAGKLLCQRQYDIPIPIDSEVVANAEALISQVLAAAVQADGQFTIG